jgi:hypothetical protein
MGFDTSSTASGFLEDPNNDAKNPGFFGAFGSAVAELVAELVNGQNPPFWVFLLFVRLPLCVLDFFPPEIL